MKIMKIFIVFNDLYMIISIIFTVFIIIKFEFVIMFGSEFEQLGKSGNFGRSLGGKLFC